MKKHYFYAIDVNPPAKLHRFPSRKAREAWVKKDGDNRAAVQQKPEHPAYWQVRRINYMVERGIEVAFPFTLEE